MMNYQYIDLNNQKDRVEGVVLKKLIIHKDTTGILVETLRKDWKGVFNKKELNFVMQYISITPPGIARDEKRWHVHNYQKDRFICASGRIITAIFDPRKNSKTKGKLNLCVMGPEKEDEMYMVVIPENTYHGFMVVSKIPGFLLNFPTRLYNPSDEGRVSHKIELDWNLVRKDFSIGKK